MERGMWRERMSVGGRLIWKGREVSVGRRNGCEDEGQSA